MTYCVQENNEASYKDPSFIDSFVFSYESFIMGNRYDNEKT